MCGIVGSFHPDTDERDPWVSEALDQIIYRGPDCRATVTWTAATHGHVRLSILDPHPRSDQPFIYGGVLLSFVGELWNYRELRTWMEENLDRRFFTEGDTEVLAAWLDHAIATQKDLGSMVNELDWMGAFAVTESVSGRTWLARDPLGEVPLYVLEEDGSLFSAGGYRWASERRCFGPGAAEATPVPAGSVWQLSDVPEFYWEPERAAQKRGVVRDVDRLNGLITTAVEKRMHADVPVAYLCSGGLDSSLILQEVLQRQPEAVAYVAAMPGYPSADLKAARALSRHWGFELREVSVPPPGEEAFRRCVETIEIPMKAQVELAWPCLWLATVISQDGFKVVLSGEGADELFGGYSNLKRRATSDAEWRKARVAAMQKMARGNCVRTNKSFMRYGVEVRLPFLDRELVEYVLPMGVKGCPPGKELLKDAARGLVPEFVIDRPKVAFQTGIGMRDAAEELLKEDVVKTYNRMARELFGGLTRG